MHSIILAWVALLLAGPSTVPVENQIKGRELNEAGWKLWQQQKLAEAEVKFDQAVKLDRSNQAAWNGLGWSRFNQGKKPEAEEAFKKCVELDRAQAGAALNGLGWIYYQKRDYDAAEKFWVDSNAPAGWSGLTQLYLLQGKWDDAIKWGEKLKASGMTGGPETFIDQMIAAAKNKSLPDDMRRNIEPAAPDAPGAADAERGWGLFQQGKFADAAEAFQAALAADPENLSAHNGLGFSLLNQGNAPEAKEHFQICLDHNPDDPGPVNGMAQCLKAEGRVDDALALWKRSHEKYPGPNAATYGLAFTYFQQGDFKQALPYLEELAKDLPENAQVKEALEQAKEEAGKK